MRLITALITPFTNSNNLNANIDYDALGKILENQFHNNVKEIVIMGSTGEGSSLSDNERNEIVEFCANKARDMSKTLNFYPKIIACVNSNITHMAINQAKNAELYGANEIMVTMPCYNKPTEDGIYEHISLIAKNTNIPIMLYNVPSRTGVNISINTVKKLFDNYSTIVGIKDATNDISRIHEMIFQFRNKILCGDDESILTFGFEGAGGIVSVISNLMPKEMTNLCDAIQNHDIKNAVEIYQQIYPIIKEIFKTTNPIGIKNAMHKTYDFISSSLRLPLL